MASTSTNRGVVYKGPGKVEVEGIDFPKLVNPKGQQAEHGVILKIVATNIYGSDQHMVRGRTTAPIGLVLGHEITGEIIEAGRCGRLTEEWETLRDKLIKTGAKIVRRARYVKFQMAEVAIPSDLFRSILARIQRLADTVPMPTG